ncbi:hypothetical protein FD20_GL001094 [Liquorilactobacillus uvarum DSM 19971]|uniref:Uncharacterized protein n=1 Tax=Liquorilactobacillus uvarum DSM 19971 TaxID=1423812 RepID=A0A0R1Q367_9LACO|nr:hypothetical protein FD20_GL001094 [Liquorilactobacillus uvarum DSM 19971]
MLISVEKVIYILILMVLISVSLGVSIEFVTFRKEIMKKNTFNKSFHSVIRHFSR